MQRQKGVNMTEQGGKWTKMRPPRGNAAMLAILGEETTSERHLPSLWRLCAGTVTKF